MKMMRRMISAATCLVALFVGPSASLGGDESVALARPEDRSQAIAEFVGQFVELAMFDGTVLVDVGGELVFEQSFGRASYELDVRHGPNTRFRVASVSKMITDTAVARLVQGGAIRLDDPLVAYLPDFPSADAIRIRHLLDHSSGIPHTNDQPWGETPLALDEIVDRLSRLPLDFEPGTSSRYSNGGYAVAARVLEIAGGAPFAGLVRAAVFAPLGMNGSGHLSDSRAVISGLASGYEPGRTPGVRRHARFYPVETRPGGGSAYSTARDVLRLMRAVFREDFVTPELRREILGADDEGFLSQGRSPGYVAKAYYGAADDVIVVSLANNYAVPADWAAALAVIASGSQTDDGWPALEPAVARVSANDGRIGRYRSSRGGAEMVIERSSSGFLLMMGGDRQSITALVPLADGSFLMPLYFQRCVQGPQSRVVTCRMLSGNPRYTSTLTPIEPADNLTDQESPVPR